MKQMVILIAFFCLFALVLGSNTEYCSEKSNLQDCAFTVPKVPIANSVSVIKLGLTRDTCLDHMNRFGWHVGIFCPESLFCGFGIGSVGNFEASGEAAPLRDLCHVIVDLKQSQCDVTREWMYDVGFIQSEVFNNLFILVLKKSTITTPFFLSRF